MRRIDLIDIRLLCFFVAFGLCLGSCRKDIDEFTPYGNTSSDIESLLSKVPNSTSVTEFLLVNQQNDTIVSTPSGARIHYLNAENLFENETGFPIAASSCPSILIRITEIIKASDIIARNISLMQNGVLPDSTTGLVQLEIFCGTTPLFIRSGQSMRVEVPAENTISKLMTYYAQRNSNGAIIGWEATQQEVFEADWPSTTGSGTIAGYDFNITQTGIFGGFSYPQNALGRICLDMPNYYSAENTKVFLFIKGGKTSFPLFYDAQTKQFCGEGIPVGLEAEVFAVSKVGDQWQTSSTPTTTALDLRLTIAQENVDEAQVLEDLRDY